MAALEMPNETMKSMSGRSNDDEIARYNAAANYECWPAASSKRLVAWEREFLSPPMEHDEPVA